MSSKLVVEVCKVLSVENHPNADKMKICEVKGWKTAIRYDPETDEAQFKLGDLCVYFPPDAIMPRELAEDRLGILKYLKALPKDDNGEQPTGGRVAAARLRGVPSFGVIMKIDPKQGDDPNWKEGDDVTDHFGITKWVPPLRSTDGDAERPHTRFHCYSSPEHYGNYVDSLKEGEEVVLTEKIHGFNCRLGLVQEENEWIFMAGSHGVRRKEFTEQRRRFDADELGLDKEAIKIGDIFESHDKRWRAIELNKVSVNDNQDASSERLFVKAVALNENGEPIQLRSLFWMMMTDNVKQLLQFVQNEFEHKEPKVSIILYGEVYGAKVQDMTYGLQNKRFRAFDLAINNEYLDYDAKTALFDKFSIPQVPLLYRGPFSKTILEEHTNGPTTACDPKEIKKGFKGREGVVIVPINERFDKKMCKRLVLKSVSADYLARKNGTDN